MRPLPDREMAQKIPMLHAWRNIQRHAFSSDPSYPWPCPPKRDPNAPRPVQPEMPPYPSWWLKEMERHLERQRAEGKEPTHVVSPDPLTQVEENGPSQWRITRFLREIFSSFMKPLEPV